MRLDRPDARRRVGDVERLVTGAGADVVRGAGTALGAVGSEREHVHVVGACARPRVVDVERRLVSQVELLIRLRQRDGELVAVAVDGRAEELDRPSRGHARADRAEVPRGARAARRPDRSFTRCRSGCSTAAEQRHEQSNGRSEPDAARDPYLHVDPPGR